MPQAVALVLPALATVAATAGGTAAGTAGLTAAGLTAGQAAALTGGLGAAGALGSGLSSFLSKQGLNIPSLPASSAATTASATPSAPAIPGNAPGVGLSPSFGNLTQPTGGAPTGQAAVQAALQQYGGGQAGDPYGGGFS
jgi:hypothetical protein